MRSAAYIAVKKAAARYPHPQYTTSILRKSQVKAALDAVKPTAPIKAPTLSSKYSSRMIRHFASPYIQYPKHKILKMLVCS